MLQNDQIWAGSITQATDLPVAHSGGYLRTHDGKVITVRDITSALPCRGLGRQPGPVGVIWCTNALRAGVAAGPVIRVPGLPVQAQRIT